MSHVFFACIEYLPRGSDGAPEAGNLMLRLRIAPIIALADGSHKPDQSIALKPASAGSHKIARVTQPSRNSANRFERISRRLAHNCICKRQAITCLKGGVSNKSILQNHYNAFFSVQKDNSVP